MQICFNFMGNTLDALKPEAALGCYLECSLISTHQVCSGDLLQLITTWAYPCFRLSSSCSWVCRLFHLSVSSSCSSLSLFHRLTSSLERNYRNTCGLRNNRPLSNYAKLQHLMFNFQTTWDFRRRQDFREKLNSKACSLFTRQLLLKSRPLLLRLAELFSQNGNLLSVLCHRPHGDPSLFCPCDRRIHRLSGLDPLIRSAGAPRWVGVSFALL